jgi:hypothetical protein
MKVGEKTPTQLGPLERVNPNCRSIFRKVVFFGIEDDGKSPEKFCEFWRSCVWKQFWPGLGHYPGIFLEGGC